MISLFTVFEASDTAAGIGKLIGLETFLFQFASIVYMLLWMKNVPHVSESVDNRFR